MSTLTGQESSTNQTDRPVNAGATTQLGPEKTDSNVPFKVGSKTNTDLDVSTFDKTTSGTQNASGASETRSGEDASSPQDADEETHVGKKPGTESLIDSTKGSAHEREGTKHLRETDRSEGRGGKKRTEPLWRGIHLGK